MSPDLNTIENLWQELKKRIRAREPSNVSRGFINIVVIVEMRMYGYAKCVAII